MPAGFLVGFVEGLLDRRAALLRQGQPATAARALAATEAVQAFHADASGRGWTVDPSASPAWPMTCSAWRRSTASVTVTCPSRPAVLPSVRCWRASAPAKRSPCRGSRLICPSGRRVGGTRNATQTTTTADPCPTRPGSYAGGLAARYERIVTTRVVRRVVTPCRGR